MPSTAAPARVLHQGRDGPRLRSSGDDVEDEVRVGLVGNIDRYLDGSVTSGAPIDPGATRDGQRVRVTAGEQGGAVEHALHPHLTAIEVEGRTAGRLAAL